METQKKTFLNRLKDILKLQSTITFMRKEPERVPLDMEKFLNAIAYNETGIVQGDPYTFSKPSGRADLGRDLGKYQVTEGTLDTYSPRYLGQKMTGDQFLASTTAQDNFVKNMANYYWQQGYTPQQIADIHRRGYKKSGPPGSSQYQDPDYVNKFNTIYNATSTSP